jgi:uncharacterized membrane protein YhaH (DUF805 family)
MATKRKVKREQAATNNTLVVNRQAPWLLPDWARQFVVQNLGWADLMLTLILTPVAILGLVLSAEALPLQTLGHPADNTGVGVSAVVLLVQFVLMALAVRPLFDHRRRGWNLVATALLVHIIYDYFQQNLLRGIILALIGFYFLLQIRRYYRA